MGKWGDAETNEEPELEIDPRIVGVESLSPQVANKVSVSKRNLSNKRKTMEGHQIKNQQGKPSIEGEVFQCLKCTKELKPSRVLVQNHLKKHR